MRKILLLLISLLTFVGCELQPNIIQMNNNTGRDVVLLVETSNGSYIETFKDGYTKTPWKEGEILSAVAIKSENEQNVIDRSCRVSVSFGMIHLYDVGYQIFTIKEFIPESGTLDGIFLTEESNMIGRYAENGKQNSILLTDLPETAVEVYSSNPNFILIDDKGEQITTIGDYSINIKVLDNDIILIF